MVEEIKPVDTQEEGAKPETSAQSAEEIYSALTTTYTSPRSPSGPLPQIAAVRSIGKIPLSERLAKSGKKIIRRSTHFTPIRGFKLPKKEVSTVVSP